MRWVRRILVFLLVLAIGIGVFGFFMVRRSFPQTDGEIQVAGLGNQVEVVRDVDGVPHIYAATTHDLFFAQGYAHAQDRFWQMDFWRHIGGGRLAEMFGEDQVEADMFLRSLDFTGIAEQELAEMPAEHREILEAYANGVNAYISGRSPSQISLEYAILPLQNSGYAIEPWTPVHSLTWAKVMSWDLSWNMLQEIDRATLSATLPVERVEQLYPDFPEDKPVIVPSDQAPTAHTQPAMELTAGPLTALLSAAERARSVWELTGGGFSGIGSNNWVVGGTHTETGMPILANDPHLAIQMPSIWYLNGLHCTARGGDCNYELAGFSFPGIPGVVIGHNEHIAWGVTNESVDTQDLFIEKINPDDPAQYEFDGDWVDAEVRTETIVVGGGEDVDFEVRGHKARPDHLGHLLRGTPVPGLRPRIARAICGVPRLAVIAAVNAGRSHHRPESGRQLRGVQGGSVQVGHRGAEPGVRRRRGEHRLSVDGRGPDQGRRRWFVAGAGLDRGA